MTDMPEPEFSRRIRIDELGRHTDSVKIVANATERAGLARRFGLLALDRLEADYALSEENGAIMARGRVRAQLAQPCVATGAAVPEKIDTDFALRFIEESAPLPEGEAQELEIDAEDCDTVGYADGILDMGEAVAETMALAMVPYPRAPDADTFLKEAGVIGEDQASPFAQLLARATKKDHN